MTVTQNEPVERNADDGKGGHEAEEDRQHSGHCAKESSNETFGGDDDDVFHFWPLSLFCKIMLSQGAVIACPSASNIWRRNFST